MLGLCTGSVRNVTFTERRTSHLTPRNRADFVAALAFGEEEMKRTFLIVVVLVALIATILSVSAPERASRSRPTFQPANSGQSHASVSNVLQAQQPPIPLVRNLAPALAPAVAPAESTAEADRPPTDDQASRAAAKAAIEADGYKGVTVLGRGGNGTWRAQAYRGSAEVRLIVDDAGTVSTE